MSSLVPPAGSETETEIETEAETDTGGPLLYPPLQVWKLALLMLSTLSLYSAFWFFRAARDVRAAVDDKFVPWRWLLAPWIGLIAAFAGGKMSARLADWADSAGAEKVALNRPASIGLTLFFASALAALPERAGLEPWSWIIAIFLLAVPFSVMQAQLNRIKSKLVAVTYRTPPMRYNALQLTTVIVCGVTVSALVFLVLQDTISRSSAETLAVGAVLEDDAGLYRLDVKVPGWQRSETGSIFEDGEMEFIARDPDDWGVIYLMDDTDLDTTTEHRVNDIMSSNADADCHEKRRLSEDASYIVSTLDCTGHDALYGYYQYRSRVLANEDVVVELLLYIAEDNRQLFKKRKAILEFVEGLSLL